MVADCPTKLRLPIVPCEDALVLAASCAGKLEGTVISMLPPFIEPTAVKVIVNVFPLLPAVTLVGDIDAPPEPSGAAAGWEEMMVNIPDAVVLPPSGLVTVTFLEPVAAVEATLMLAVS